MVFDINDFDETLPGPWEWDVKRLVASLAVAGRDNGYSRKERRRICMAGAATYRKAMRGFADSGNLDVFYASIDMETWMQEWGGNLTTKQRRKTEASVEKARTHDSMQALGKLTEMVDGERRIISDPPVLVPIEAIFPEQSALDLYAALREVFQGYRRSLQPDRRVLIDQFHMVQVARKVVGVGSVGTRAWIILLLGRDDGDPLFLQAKEAQPSVLEAYAGASAYGNQGRRVVAGQQIMQAASDIFLGATQASIDEGVTRDFYLRQLRDGKGSADIETMVPTGMEAYAGICAWTLARAHACSGDRIAIASYLGRSDRFEQAVADVRRDLRRPERVGLPRAGDGRADRPDQDRTRAVTGRRQLPRACPAGADVGRAQISCSSRARRMASLRRDTDSLRRMLRMWDLTVLTDTNIVAATSSVVSRSAR